MSGRTAKILFREPLLVNSPARSSIFHDEESRIRSAYARRHGDNSRYSWFDPGHLFFIQERERQLLALLKKQGLESLKRKTILEIGCGSGYWLREFVKWGAQPENLTGIDLLSERITEARSLCPEKVKLHSGNAAYLEFAESAFDLVLQSTVFTSILDWSTKQELAGQMLRVLKDDGAILWYDYHLSNPRNPDVRGVKKKEIYALFPGCSINLQRITLAPPLARLLAPYSWTLCYFLERLPWLCSHYLGVIRKR